MCMEYVWCVYDMLNVWCMYMLYVWCVYDMMCVWCVYDMVYVWCVYKMMCVWCVYDMVYVWCVYEMMCVWCGVCMYSMHLCVSIWIHSITECPLIVQWIMVDLLSYFLFQQVFHDLCKKCCAILSVGWCL